MVEGVPTPLPKRRKPKKGHVWLFRMVDEDLISYGGFQWPALGEVEAPDWHPQPRCGAGLHAYDLRNQCMFHASTWDPKNIFQVVEVSAKSVVKLDGKVKFPKCTVIYSGAAQTALDLVVGSGIKPFDFPSCICDDVDGGVLREFRTGRLRVAGFWQIPNHGWGQVVWHAIPWGWCDYDMSWSRVPDLFPYPAGFTHPAPQDKAEAPRPRGRVAEKSPSGGPGDA